MKATKPHRIMRVIKTNLFVPLVSFLFIFGLGISGCEGPQGPAGAKGSQGEQGPIGPAGEDGSVMYAGEGAPAGGTGKVGDYYLNQNTGELYGPKSADGWGNPIIVLMGEDGKNGQDGADGQDGEDGSQIYSGSGAPAGTLGKVGDFYLDKSSYELYGPKTSSGWGTPLNLKGADGNANVTRYIFSGPNFNNVSTVTRIIPDVQSEQEMRQSTWLVYLISSAGYYYSLPGYGIGGFSQYRVTYAFDTYNQNNELNFIFFLENGNGEDYPQTEIIRIEASNTVDLTSNSPGSSNSIVPSHLDLTDYQSVAEHYGLNKQDIIPVSAH